MTSRSEGKGGLHYWLCFSEGLGFSKSFFIVSRAKVLRLLIVPERPVSIQKLSRLKVHKAGAVRKGD